MALVNAGQKDIVILYLFQIVLKPFCRRGCVSNHPSRDIIDNTRLAINRDWQVTLIYRDRKHLRDTDYLAKIAYTIRDPFYIHDQSPPRLHRVDPEDGF